MLIVEPQAPTPPPSLPPSVEPPPIVVGTSAHAQAAAMQSRADETVRVPRPPPPPDARVEVPGLGVGTYVGPAPRLLRSDQHLVQLDALPASAPPVRLTAARGAAAEELDASRGWAVVRGVVSASNLITGAQHRVLLRPGMTVLDLHVAVGLACGQPPQCLQLAGVGGRPDVLLPCGSVREAAARLPAARVYEGAALMVSELATAPAGTREGTLGLPPVAAGGGRDDSAAVTAAAVTAAAAAALAVAAGCLEVAQLRRRLLALPTEAPEADCAAAERYDVWLARDPVRLHRSYCASDDLQLCTAPHHLIHSITRNESLYGCHTRGHRWRRSRQTRASSGRCVCACVCACVRVYASARACVRVRACRAGGRCTGAG